MKYKFWSVMVLVIAFSFVFLGVVLPFLFSSSNNGRVLFGFVLLIGFIICAPYIYQKVKGFLNERKNLSD